ncbi:MAG: quinone-dependent dihydroorotate dehydrogenase [bacterium]
MNTYNLFKNLAFKLDPELIHEFSMKSFGVFPRVLSGLFSSDTPKQAHQIEVAGLKWSSPVGLAAGLDKNAAAIDFFSRLPFGAIEVGTVTPKAQEGNPKPRLFRLIEQESLLNRMGFNNHGMNTVLDNITALDPASRPRCLGVNLGKNKTTSPDKAALDYQVLYKKFCHVADYMVINVSSPNTPGLRDLQEESALAEIFDALADVRQLKNVPLFLKVAPDLPDQGLDACVSIAKKYKLAGLIATNTTIIPDIGVGGVSGQLLKEKSKRVRHYLLNQLRETPRIELIGVGGVSSFDDVWDFWRQGGRAMQVYTGFIYKGPGLLVDIAKSIDLVLEKTKAMDLSELLKDPQKLPADWRM